MTEPTDKQKEEAQIPMPNFTPEQIAKHLSETTDDYDSRILQAGNQDDWMFASCARVYVNNLLTALSSRDTEIREVLEGLRRAHDMKGDPCWCENLTTAIHESSCLAARALWNKLQPTKEGIT